MSAFSVDNISLTNVSDKINNFFQFFTSTNTSQNSGNQKDSVLRRRRVRCKRCVPCTKEECGECTFCKDMKKFGGLGKMKQTCISRQCIAPILPTAAICVICGKSESDINEKIISLRNENPNLSSLIENHFSTFDINSKSQKKSSNILKNENTNQENPFEFNFKVEIKKSNKQTNSSSYSPSITSLTENELMECSICWKIVHICCLKMKLFQQHLNSIKQQTEQIKQEQSVVVWQAWINEELPNSWECPLCCENSSKLPTKSHKSKHHKSLALPSADIQKTSILQAMLKQMKQKTEEEEEDEESLETIKIFQEVQDNMDKKVKKKRRKSEEITKSEKDLINPDFKLGPYKPLYFYRPPPSRNIFKKVKTTSSSAHPLSMVHWILIFKKLSTKDLLTCSSVCKAWNLWTHSSLLWQFIDMSKKNLRKVHFDAIVKKQPQAVDLSHTNISRPQLLWILQRLFRLHRIHLSNCSSHILPAFTQSFLFLEHLDLSWLSGLTHKKMVWLMDSPCFDRPGTKELREEVEKETSFKGRFRNLKIIDLSGTEVEDETVILLSKRVPFLQKLNLSYCIRISIATVNFLKKPVEEINVLANPSYPMPHLSLLNLDGCHWLDLKSVEDSFKFDSKSSVFDGQKRPNLKISCCLP